MTVSAVFSYGIEKVVTEPLFQYDIGQKLSISGLEVDGSTEIHFKSPYSKIAKIATGTLEGSTLTVDIPDEFLENSGNGLVWVCLTDENAVTTIRTISIPIKERAKPDGYVSKGDGSYKKFDEEIAKLNAGFLHCEKTYSLGAVTSVNSLISYKDKGTIYTGSIAYQADYSGDFLMFIVNSSRYLLTSDGHLWRFNSLTATTPTKLTYTAAEVEELLDEVDESASIKINLKADKDSVDSAFAALNKTVSDNKAETDTALDGKADKATTLAGYGITDAYTKTLSDRMYSCQISIAFDENHIPLTFVSNSRLMSAHFSAVSEKIRYVYISSHVDMVDSDAFSGCTNLYAVYYGVNDNDRIDHFSAIIRSALPNNPITFANTSRREISDFLIKSIKSLSEIKYDSSNVENGSGTLSPATSADTGCEGNFIYSKNGNTVTVTVNMTKFLAGKNYFHMSGLPFKQNLSIRLASLLARASSDDYVNVRIDGSWLYFTKSSSSFADDETLIVTVTYII